MVRKTKIKPQEKIIKIEKVSGKKYVGYQISAEFYGVKNISHTRQLIPILKKALNESKLKVVKNKKPIVHQFKPYGVTAVVLLEESHIALHSWPEYNYIAIDIFSCSGKKKADKAYKVFKQSLKPKMVRKIEMYKQA